MRRLAITLLVFANVANANVMPTVRTPSGYDRIRTADGLTCESSIASDTYIQTGIYSVNGNDSEPDDKGIFAQVVIPLTGAKKRLDCSRLYEIELQARQLEVEQLKKQIELMQQQGFKIYK